MLDESFPALLLSLDSLLNLLLLCCLLLLVGLLFLLGSSNFRLYLLFLSLGCFLLLCLHLVCLLLALAVPLTAVHLAVLAVLVEHLDRAHLIVPGADTTATTTAPGSLGACLNKLSLFGGLFSVVFFHFDAEQAHHVVVGEARIVTSPRLALASK